VKRVRREDEINARTVDMSPNEIATSARKATAAPKAVGSAIAGGHLGF
jgi:hypothetical protein